MNKRLHILVTGSPGTGKTRLSACLAKELEAQHLNVSSIIAERKLYRELDASRNCNIYDGDLLFEYLDGILAESTDKYIVDFHDVTDFALARWFDIIIILQTDLAILEHRLKQRGYSEQKTEENLDCERFCTAKYDVVEYFEQTQLPYTEISDVDQISVSCKNIVTPFILLLESNHESDCSDHMEKVKKLVELF